MSFYDCLYNNLYIIAKKVLLNKQIKKYKNYISRNKELCDIYNGERCFILANGPSLSGLDFALLENEYTFTVNQLVRNPQFGKLKTNFHVWADRIFFEIDLNKDEDVEMLRTIKSVTEISPNVKVFYEVAALPMIKQFKLDIHPYNYYFHAEGLNPRAFEYKTIDFSQVVPNYPTVIDYCILLAVYMGFKEIYLLGCDCTSILNIVQNKLKNAQNNSYAYRVSVNDAKRMEMYASQRSIIDELKSQVAVFETYEALSRYCNRQNASLYNATDGGVLESIQRVRLCDII